MQTWHGEMIQQKVTAQNRSTKQYLWCIHACTCTHTYSHTHPHTHAHMLTRTPTPTPTPTPPPHTHTERENTHTHTEREHTHTHMHIRTQHTHRLTLSVNTQPTHQNIILTNVVLIPTWVHICTQWWFNHRSTRLIPPANTAPFNPDVTAKQVQSYWWMASMQQVMFASWCVCTMFACMHRRMHARTLLLELSDVARPLPASIFDVIAIEAGGGLAMSDYSQTCTTNRHIVRTVPLSTKTSQQHGHTWTIAFSQSWTWFVIV